MLKPAIDSIFSLLKSPQHLNALAALKCDPSNFSSFLFSMVLKSPIPLDQLKFNVPVRYKLHVDRKLLDITRKKLALSRYPEEQSDFGENNWAQGANVSRVKQLAEHWQNKYDWETQEVISNPNGYKICSEAKT